MKLAYRAFDKSGREVADTIEAGGAAEAAESLRRQELYVTEVTQVAGSSTPRAKRLSLVLGRGRRLKNLAMFTRQLYVLVSSGTPVVQSLGALERQVSEGGWRDIIGRVRRKVEEGAALAEAMRAHPEYFDPVYCSLVAAGESAGTLGPMLERLGKLTQKRLHVRNSILGAMIYPCLLVAVATVVLVLLLLFVIPRFAGLFESLGVQLPASTKLLVAFSEALQSYWWAMLIVLAGSVVAAKVWLGTPAGKQVFDATVLRLPQIGRLVRSFVTARITRLLGVLLENHVPVLEALRLTRDGTGNTQYSELIARAEEAVVRGESMSSALSKSDLISPSVSEAISNGERSGQVGPLLLNISDFLDEDNEVVIRSLTSILEPVILIFMGVLVGLVALSLFMPLFDLAAMTGGGGA